MAQGMLGAGIRRVGYGLEVGQSMRTVGRARAYSVATCTACYICLYVFQPGVDFH